MTIIAIDGPAAAGKGTLARRLAAELGFDYLDTGLIYRAVGMNLRRAGTDPADEAAAEAAARALVPLDLAATDLRGDDAAQAASKVAAIPGVRAALLDFQRRFAHTPPGGKGAVLDGRDIGTVVCPDAEVKLFVTASLEKRAERRLKELQAAGRGGIQSAVLADMKERDDRDRNRSVAPLKPADGAIVLDTSDLDADQAFVLALSYIRTGVPE
ncbi:(d)CMP kinase [Magnetospirillum fulvum]|uniref:Cytidylate kinase n=1 Tax=Magnetospirillum fulvum MGU-K5 TaxID=1316936 RepID=S9TGI8_MAGFU|nr:(d)CMP kinase [Magnetospirillum fulvum]EPY01401.1 cytidylate kinase [Magnetospirillum fulvum MGU-K5]